MTCTHTWCDGTIPGHTEHSGILATVSAGGNDIDVRIYLDTDPEDDCLTYSFDWDWSIASGDAPREFAVLRSLLDQIEAVIREAETVYPRVIRAEVAA